MTLGLGDRRQRHLPVRRKKHIDDCCLGDGHGIFSHYCKASAFHRVTDGPIYQCWPFSQVTSATAMLGACRVATLSHCSAAIRARRGRRVSLCSNKLVFTNYSKVIPPRIHRGEKWNFFQRKGSTEKQKPRFTNSQIMDALKRVDSGISVPDVCRELGISTTTLNK